MLGALAFGFLSICVMTIHALVYGSSNTEFVACFNIVLTRVYPKVWALTKPVDRFKQHSRP